MALAPTREEKSTIGRSIDPAAAGALVERFARPLRPLPARVPTVPGADARPFQVTSGRYTLAAWTWGDGPLVLLAHGWNGDAAQLAGFVPPLLEAGFGVVAFDQPAHGGSSGDRATVLDLAEAAVAVAGAAGTPFGVLAHSLGATSSVLALERLGAERAVLVAPVAHPRYVARAYAWLEGYGDDAASILLDAIEGEVGDLRAIDLRNVAERMTVPALFMHDPEDPEVPFRHSEAIVARSHGAELRQLEAMGHRAMLRDHATIEAAVSFLAQSRTTR